MTQTLLYLRFRQLCDKRNLYTTYNIRFKAAFDILLFGQWRIHDDDDAVLLSFLCSRLFKILTNDTKHLAKLENTTSFLSV